MSNNKKGMTVEEGNKLIELFYSDRELSPSGVFFGRKKGSEKKFTWYDIVAVDDLKYHSSWDWLMPSWKKLGGLLYERRGEFDKEQYSKAHVYTQHILRAFQTVEIETAFYLIAETIQWYNTQTPQP